MNSNNAKFSTTTTTVGVGATRIRVFVGGAAGGAVGAAGGGVAAAAAAAAGGGGLWQFSVRVVQVMTFHTQTVSRGNATSHQSSQHHTNRLTQMILTCMYQHCPHRTF